MKTIQPEQRISFNEWAIYIRKEVDKFYKIDKHGKQDHSRNEGNIQNARG